MLNKEKFWFTVAFVFFTLINIEAQQTIWFSPLSLVSGSSEVTVVPSEFTNLSAAAITSNNLGSNNQVLLGLNLSSNQKIDSIIINYRLSNSASFIDQIRLAEMTSPNFSSVISDDPTDLTSTEAARYSNYIGSVPVNGTVTLLLFLNFADPADIIYIGAIGVVVSQTTTSMNEQPQSEVPNNFKLEQNYPNPFNPSTKIDYFLKSSDKVKINIYDSNGTLVRTLLNEEQVEGPNSVIWNGKDNHGELLSSGVYFYQLQVGNYTEAKKMIMLK